MKALRLSAVLPLMALMLVGCGREEEPPNLVIILADDMGYSDVGAYGGEIETPALDRLAEGGLRFRQFYNAARCCPTRASLLTGLYPHQAGMGRMVSAVGQPIEAGPYQGFLADSSVTLAEALGQAGYRTYMSGKWHVGERPEHWPTKRGFDRYWGLISGASSYFEVIRDQPRHRQIALDGEPWSPPDSGFYMTTATTDWAVDFLQQHAEEAPDDPFFLYVAYTAPHWPLHALPEDIAKYEGRYDLGWDSLRAERYERMQAMGLLDERHVLSPRPATVPAWEDATDHDDWARRMEVYAAMIDRMDQGIGRVMDQLEAMGADENTLVLFLSDNGACAESIEGRNLHNPDVPIGQRGSYVAYKEPWANVGSTPFRLYKQWTHEGGIATPLIAHWPAGIEAPGRLTDATGHVIDFMATALDLAGTAYPDSSNGRPTPPLEGKSLAPVFQNEDREGHDALFWEHFDNRAVRQGDWKLAYDARRAQAWGLYNLAEDPTELNDLSEEHPEKRDELMALYEAWAERTGVYEEEDEVAVGEER